MSQFKNYFLLFFLCVVMAISSTSSVFAFEKSSEHSHDEFCLHDIDHTHTPVGQDISIRATEHTCGGAIYEASRVKIPLTPDSIGCTNSTPGCTVTVYRYIYDITEKCTGCNYQRSHITSVYKSYSHSICN